MKENPKSLWDQVNDILFKLGCVVFVTILLLAWVGDAFAEPPTQSLRYRNDLIRNSRAVGGMEAPVALFAGQIHQESAWRPDVSSAYAHGLAQFTPDTSEWISSIYPELRENQPFNPSWALRALVRYDYWLRSRIHGDTDCDKWAMVLSAYNGGLGWLLRDKTLARVAKQNPYLWFGHVELYSKRADWAFKENRSYPRRILRIHQHNYTTWGQGVACELG